VAADREQQLQVEVILLKQMASYLATPIFVVDPEGNLVYFNEPAEGILGRRYDEAGDMALDELASIFNTTDEHGAPIPRENQPLVCALEQRRPAHVQMWIRGLDGAIRHIAVTAFPLVGQDDRNLGAVAIFWEDLP
jgi:PAS domain S-box-containing protein